MSTGRLAIDQKADAAEWLVAGRDESIVVVGYIGGNATDIQIEISTQRRETN